jgi:hypothetical protein
MGNGMIFRQQDYTQRTHRKSAKRALIWRLPVFVLLGLLCFNFTGPTPARAQDRGDGQRQIDIGRYVLTSMGDGRWLVTDRQTGDTRVVREQWTSGSDQSWGGDHDRSRDSDRDRLGRVWREQESGWSGLWRRRGDTNVFDAVWTGPGRVTATLEINFDGPDKVKIERRNSSDGNNCHYAGRFSGGSSFGGLTVSGNYRCGNGPLVPWSATIER